MPGRGAISTIGGALHCLLRAVEMVLLTLAGAGLVTMMVVVSCDAVLRYVVNRPLPWAHDLVSLYLMPGIFFLVLSFTFRTGAHVAVDLFLQRASPRVRRHAEILGCAAAVPLFATIAWQGALRTAEAWFTDAVVPGTVPWPTWAFLVFVPVGAGLLTLQLVARIAGGSAAAQAGEAHPEEPASGCSR